MQALHDALKQCAERLDRYMRHGQRIGEQNTKASLIEPVIGALGWDVLDPDEVHREYRRRPSDNPVDYALLLARTPRLFIEAKGLGENLDEPKWANQVISYAAVAGVEWVALTDGAQWRIYNAHAPVPIEQKLFRSVHVVEDLHGAVDVLALLSKDDMRDNRIQELWKGFFVDRQVRTALLDLFGGTDPARELVNLLSKRLPTLSRAEVRSSLLRARASFDFPAAAVLSVERLAVPPVAPAPPSENGSASERRPPSRPARRLVGKDERKLGLRELIDAGLLSAPATIVADYFGQQYRAEVLADGTVSFNGKPMKSLSAAGTAVKEAARGPEVDKIATDGWAFWKTIEPDSGRLVTLKALRRRLATTT